MNALFIANGNQSRNRHLYRYYLTKIHYWRVGLDLENKLLIKPNEILSVSDSHLI